MSNKKLKINEKKMSAVRANDITSCNGICIDSEVSVKINGRSAHRLGDSDTCGVCAPPSTGVVINGSATVFVVGQPIAIVGLSVDTCGATIITGSTDVLVGG